jgi:CO/xanthine dehydrogenase FAD-binding subunit
LDDHVPLGGGTILNADDDPTLISLVDLQELALSGISVDGDGITIGSMTSLQEIADCDQVPQVVRQAARAELPSTLRTLGTLGGAVAVAHPDSRLLAALLVCKAIVDTSDLGGPSEHLLAEWPNNSGRLVTGVRIDTGGSLAFQGTGRTPADTPIVSATIRCTEQETVMSLTGVAKTPVLVDPTNPTASLKPISDFRGSASYRLHLASTMAARAVALVREDI